MWKWFKRLIVLVIVLFFAVAADKIQEKYGIPVLMKFELSGTNTEVENYINYLENNYK